MRLNIHPICLVVFLWLFSPFASAKNIELGFEPGHVFGLWVNINQVLLDCSERVVDDEEWLQSLKQWPIRTVSDKQPKDVLELARQFNQSLEQSFPDIQVQLHAIRDEIMFQNRDDLNQVKPTQVYLFSSQLLFKMVRMSLKVNPNTIVGPYFAINKSEGKTPSDVYAQVELAHYRLLALLTRIGKPVDNR